MKFDRMRITQPAKNFLRLPADEKINLEVRHHFKGNFINNALDGILWMLGESFVSVNTILPVFASTMTESAVIIGLVPAMINAGWFLPQLLMAGYVQRLPQKMPFTKAMAIVERLPYLLLPLTALLLRWVSTDLALAFFLIIIAWRGLASGMSALPWQEVIATVIPAPVRSRFFGVSRTVGRLMGVIGSAITMVILATLTYPDNYALSFLVGAIFIWVSYFFFAKTKEPEHQKIILENDSDALQGIRKDFQSYWKILARDTNIVRYLCSRILFQLGSMGVAFYAVYGIQKYQFADEHAAIFSGLMFFSGTIGFIILSLIGDHLGPRKTLLVSDFLQTVALLLALLSPGIWSIYLIFLILGFAQSGYIIGDLIFSMELGPESERAIYIGLTRTLPGIFILMAPLIGGVLVEQFNYQVMFSVALVFSISATLILLGVKERKTTAIQTNNL